MKLSKPTKKVKTALWIINDILLVLYISLIVPFENWMVQKVGAEIAIIASIMLMFLLVIFTVYNITDGFTDRSTDNPEDYDF